VPWNLIAVTIWKKSFDFPDRFGSTATVGTENLEEKIPNEVEEPIFSYGFSCSTVCRGKRSYSVEGKLGYTG